MWLYNCQGFGGNSFCKKTPNGWHERRFAREPAQYNGYDLWSGRSPVNRNGQNVALHAVLEGSKFYNLARKQFLKFLRIAFEVQGLIGHKHSTAASLAQLQGDIASREIRASEYLYHLFIYDYKRDCLHGCLPTVCFTCRRM